SGSAGATSGATSASRYMPAMTAKPSAARPLRLSRRASAGCRVPSAESDDGRPTTDDPPPSAIAAPTVARAPWSVVCGPPLLITHHSSLITHHSSLITHHSSLGTRHSLPVADARVGRGVGDVGEQVAGEHGDGAHHIDAEDHRIIADEDRVE